jgi:predicted nucleic acid-binding protein
MFDTVIFGKILDDAIDVSSVTATCKLFCTHIQEDEIRKTADLARRTKLLEIFSSIPQELVPTESAIWGISKYGLSKYSDPGNDLVTRISDEIHKLQKQGNRRKKKSANRVKDALIAETAAALGAVLVSDDTDLRCAALQMGISATTLQDFLKSIPNQTD